MIIAMFGSILIILGTLATISLCVQDLSPWWGLGMGALGIVLFMISINVLSRQQSSASEGASH